MSQKSKINNSEIKGLTELKHCGIIHIIAKTHLFTMN